MTPQLVSEWIDKAEADFQGAAALHRRRKDPLPDLVCFHAQQSVEKYLKALLIAHGVQPPRSHDLLELLDLCVSFAPDLDPSRPRFQSLNDYAVPVRYPGFRATVDEAREAMKTA